MTPLIDVVLLGIPGPTHGFGGLAPGNHASQTSAGRIAHPRAAAKQSLALAEILIDLGVPCAFQPPPPRPWLPGLRALGFTGPPAEVIAHVAADDPDLLRRMSSAAAMWCANLGTVVPGCDVPSGITSVQLANLACHPHRAIEPATAHADLNRLLSAVPDMNILPPVPSSWGDEGAANHLRLAGTHVLIHGGGHGWGHGPQHAPARQHPRASLAVARRAGLDPQRYLLVQQRPRAIDAGVFHNDVIAMAHGRRLFCHHMAWCDQAQIHEQLAERCPALRIAEVTDEDLSLSEAVSSYVFNSQIVTAKDGRQVLIAAQQCSTGRPRAVIDRWCTNGLIDTSVFCDLGQSMANGGGPACLRLRLPLRPDQIAKLQPGMLLNQERLADLHAWVDHWYPHEMSTHDLADPELVCLTTAADRDLDQRCNLPPRGISNV